MNKKAPDNSISEISLSDLLIHLKSELKKLDKRISTNEETYFKLDNVTLEANVVVSKTKNSNDNTGIKLMVPGIFEGNIGAGSSESLNNQLVHKIILNLSPEEINNEKFNKSRTKTEEKEFSLNTRKPGHRLYKKTKNNHKT